MFSLQRSFTTLVRCIPVDFYKNILVEFFLDFFLFKFVFDIQKAVRVPFFYSLIVLYIHT